jgi:hypothetical protein
MAERKRHEELVVITKTYDLILWSCNHTGKFPRNHRFVLGERIERNLYDLLEILIRAKYTRPRQELLEQANLALEILRFQIRLAKDLQCLRVESYGFAAKAIDDRPRSHVSSAHPWSIRSTFPRRSLPQTAGDGRWRPAGKWAASSGQER